MNDVGLVETVLDFTGFSFFDGFSNVHGHCAGFGVRHQALGTEHTAEAANNTHHIRSGDDNIKVKPVFLGDFLNKFISADIFSSGCSRFIGLGAFGEDKHTHLFAGTVRQNNRSANLLIGVTGVNAQTDVAFHSFVKFGMSHFGDQLHCLAGVINFTRLELFHRFLIFLSSFHGSLLISEP